MTATEPDVPFPGHISHGRLCLYSSHGDPLRQNSARVLWAALAVSYYDCWEEVLRSALRHGILSEDVHHAIINAVAVDEVGDDRSAGWSLGQTRPGTCSNWW
jgi:hypothetical protein